MGPAGSPWISMSKKTLLMIHLLSRPAVKWRRLWRLPGHRATCHSTRCPSRAAAAARRCVLGGRVRRRGGDERQEVGFRSRAAAAAVGLRGVGGGEQARAAADSGRRGPEAHAAGGVAVSGERSADRG